MKVFILLLVLKLTFGFVCLDNRFECPDGHSCCQLTSGEQGCCPLSKAVCCLDGIHCCPHSYECDHRGFCTRGMEIVPLARKQKALINKKFKKDYIVPMRRIVRSMVTKMHETDERDTKMITEMPDIHRHEPESYTLMNNKDYLEKSKDLLHTVTQKTAEIQNLKQKIPDHETPITCPHWFSAEFCVDSLCCATREGSWEYFGCCPYENGQCCGKGCCRAGDKCVQGFCQTSVTSLLFFDRLEM